MDILTFKTAIRLKEAGFPQPEFAPGQFWYDQNGLSFVIRNNAGILTAVWFDKPMEASLNLIQLKVYFAPTTADILRVLLFRFSLCYGGNGKFIINEVISLNDMAGDVICSHENPAEAPALAWLEIYETK